MIDLFLINIRFYAFGTILCFSNDYMSRQTAVRVKSAFISPKRLTERFFIFL